MARITLTNGFSLIPEGTHVFKIVNVDYKDKFGKLEVTMETKDGSKHIERYSFKTKDGGENTGAYNAFSYFVRQAMDGTALGDDIDPVELVGHYVEGDVTHEKIEKRDEPGKTMTFIRLNDERPATGFEASASVPVKTNSSELPSLDDLLG